MAGTSSVIGSAPVGLRRPRPGWLSPSAHELEGGGCHPPLPPHPDSSLVPGSCGRLSSAGRASGGPQGGGCGGNRHGWRDRKRGNHSSSNTSNNHHHHGEEAVRLRRRLFDREVTVCRGDGNCDGGGSAMSRLAPRARQPQLRRASPPGPRPRRRLSPPPPQPTSSPGSSRRRWLFSGRGWRPRAVVVRTWLVALALTFLAGRVAASTRDHPDPSAKQLHWDLMTPYQALVKPSGRPLHQLTVKLGLRLSQVLDVDEKNQIITISVWLRQEWYDVRLKWDPSDYGGVTKLNIPSDDLWKPDIVLYNNADGDFVVTLKTKATVYHTGKIVWEPPAIYKSYCPINVEYFPFDVQECFMKFSSWTYNGNEVDLQHMCNGTVVADSIVIQRGIDMKDYYYNVEWDVINVTARRKVKFYTCCPDPFPDITFNITLRRRTLFYTLNLITPCIAISCLTVLVFYLPSDSGEKITLSISILLALTVFFLLLSDMNPPTSLVIPLIGKYLLFVMLVVTASIFLTVYTLHINFKSPSTAKMSPWVKRIFTEILPRALLMKRPETDLKRMAEEAERHLSKQKQQQRPSPGAQQRSAHLRAQQPPVLPPQHNRAHNRAPNGPEARQAARDGDGDWSAYENLRQRHGSGEEESRCGGGGEGSGEEGPPSATAQRFPPEVDSALKGVRFIANHLRQGDKDLAEERDWKYICMVIDRLFLYIFTAACFGGTLSIFLSAPSLYDPRTHIAREDNTSNCQY